MVCRVKIDEEGYIGHFPNNTVTLLNLWSVSEFDLTSFGRPLIRSAVILDFITGGNKLVTKSSQLEPKFTCFVWPLIVFRKTLIQRPLCLEA